MNKERSTRVQDSSDLVKKEMDYRKRVLRDFNKRPEDFRSEHAYNDYLELVEDIIYKLVNGIDIDETNALIQKYKAENQEFIRANQAKKAEEDRIEAERIAAEERERRDRLKALRALDLQEEEEAKRLRKLKLQEEIDLAQGKAPKKTDRKKLLKAEDKPAAVPAPVPQFIQIPPALLQLPKPTIKIVPPEERKTDAPACARAGGYSVSVCRKRAYSELKQMLFC